jgi:hypothetical protein
MYKRTGPVNKETQDDVARRSNPSCFRAQEEFRVRLEAAGAHPRQQRRLDRHNLQPAGLEASKGVISVNYSNDPSIRAGRTLPGTKKYFDFMAKYYADGDAQPTGAGLQERRIRRPTSELWF